MRRERQRSSKTDPTRRSRRSVQHSSSTSVCARTGSTLAAAAQAGPPLGMQETRPGGRRHRGPGLHTWSLSRRICPGNGNPQKELLVKAKVDGGPANSGKGAESAPVHLPNCEPTAQPQHAGGPHGRRSRPNSSRVLARRLDRRLRPSPGHPTPFPPSDFLCNRRRPLTSLGHSTLGDPKPGRSLPPRSSHAAHRTGGRRQEGLCQGRGRDSLAKGRSCTGERVPGPLPSGSASAPRSRLLRGATSMGDMGTRFREMASLGVPRAALLCWLHAPAPTAAKPRAGKGPEPSTSTLRAVLPRAVPCPALEVLPHPTPRRPGTERLWGLAGAAGLRRGSSGFTNHISSLCAGSKQPVA